jgi:hypothetical protein
MRVAALRPFHSRVDGPQPVALRKQSGSSYVPRTETKATVNNFVGGLVSDFHELNQPPNTTTDEDNCDLDRKGNRKRRLGIDIENDFDTGPNTWTAAQFPTLYTKAYTWSAVNEDGSLNFKVVQGGSQLLFFDMNFDTLSNGRKSFSIDLATHKAPGYYTTDSYGIQVASGKGALFVVGEAINPFYVQYNLDTDTITTTPITIRIRDLQLQDPLESYQNRPVSLTSEQTYDRYNMGWGVSASVDSTSTSNQGIQPVMPWYRRITGHYPDKSKSWWLGKILNPSRGIENFQPENYDEVYVGNMLAPLGTFILDAFNKDRAAASGIAGLEVETEVSRPTAVAFMSGRVFYGFKNKVFFSQVLDDDFSRAGNCFQDADPTSEKISDLVATDGGMLQIIDSSGIVSFFVYENALFSFAINGIWAIGGSAVGGGFAATDFSVYKVTDVGLLSPRSILSVEGPPCWWSKLGIYMITPDPAKQGYGVTNLLEGKLQLFYNAIPPLSKARASGAYDSTKKNITWLYNSTTSDIADNPYVGDTLLNYDTILKAFYKYSVTEVTTPGQTSPYLVDVFNVNDIVLAITEEVVVDEALVDVVDEALATVTIQVGTPTNAGNTTSSLKYLTFWQHSGVG